MRGTSFVYRRHNEHTEYWVLTDCSSFTGIPWLKVWYAMYQSSAACSISLIFCRCPWTNHPTNIQLGENVKLFIYRKEWTDQNQTWEHTGRVNCQASRGWQIRKRLSSIGEWPLLRIDDGGGGRRRNMRASDVSPSPAPTHCRRRPLKEGGRRRLAAICARGAGERGGQRRGRNHNRSSSSSLHGGEARGAGAAGARARRGGEAQRAREAGALGARARCGGQAWGRPGEEAWGKFGRRVSKGLVRKTIGFWHKHPQNAISTGLHLLHLPQPRQVDPSWEIRRVQSKW